MLKILSYSLIAVALFGAQQECINPTEALAAVTLAVFGIIFSWEF